MQALHFIDNWEKLEELFRIISVYLEEKKNTIYKFLFWKAT